MRKVVFEIDKEGKVELRAEGYKSDECMRSEKVRRLLSTIDEVDSMKKLYEEQKQEAINYEELI